MNKCNMRRINKFLLMNGFLVMVPLIICGKKKGSAESHEAAKDKAKKSTVHKAVSEVRHKEAPVKHGAAEKSNKGNKKNTSMSRSVVVSAPIDAPNATNVLKDALRKKQSEIDKMKSDFKAQHGVELQLDQDMKNKIDGLIKEVLDEKGMARGYRVDTERLATAIMIFTLVRYIIPKVVGMIKAEGNIVERFKKSSATEVHDKAADVIGNAVVAGAKKVFTVTKEFVTKSGASLQALAQKAGEQAGNIYNGYDKKAFVEWAERVRGSTTSSLLTDARVKEAINVLSEKKIFDVQGVPVSKREALKVLHLKDILTKPNMKKGEFVSVLSQKAKKMVPLRETTEGEEATGEKDKNEKREEKYVNLSKPLDDNVLLKLRSDLASPELKEKNNATHENMDFYKY